jgi:alpha-L-rhamnosidase
MLSHDATTMWERWEQATGRGMNSHNHAMYGSVGAWFYRALAGIQTRADGPGFGRFSIHPYVPAGMKYARASLITIRGLVESAWEVSENAFFLRVYVPVSSQAHVDLPAFGSAESLSVFETGTLIWANGQQRGTVPGLLDIQEGGQTVSLIIGSGAYEFTVTKQ